jgi:hypothetical protein
MLLLALLGGIFTKNAATQLEKQFECFQGIENSWTLDTVLPDAYAVFKTDRKSKVDGIKGDAYVLVNPYAQVEQMEFSWEVEGSMEDFLDTLFKQVDNKYGEADVVTPEVIQWFTDDDNLVQVSAITNTRIALTYACMRY